MFGGSSAPPAPPSPKPPYTPSYADPSVVAAGITGFRPMSSQPDVSNTFRSFLGGAGGLGRRPDLAGRSLVTGQ